MQARQQLWQAVEMTSMDAYSVVKAHNLLTIDTAECLFVSFFIQHFALTPSSESLPPSVLK